MPSLLGSRILAKPLALVVCLFIASCATDPSREATSGGAAVDDRDGIVFFSVVTRTYNSNGDALAGDAIPRISYTLAYSAASGLAAKQLAPIFGIVGKSGGNVAGTTREPEMFLVRRLPAGEYSMFKLQTGVGAISGSTNIDVRFSVAPNTATYIGALRMDFRGRKGVFGEERPGQSVALSVVSDQENATRVFRERNPDFTQEVAASLMRIEK